MDDNGYSGNVYDNVILDAFDRDMDADIEASDLEATLEE